MTTTYGVHHRSRILVLLAILAGAIALIGTVPAAAATAATPPGITGAFSSQDDNGIVQIYADAEAGIESLTAHIRSDSGEELATLTSFSLTSGTVNQGLFSSDARVHLEKFGIYRIDVDAVDTLGQRTSRSSAGVLVYAIKPIFSALSFDHTNITYTRRTVKVSGTLSGKSPVDGLLRPIARMPLEIRASWGRSAEVQTNTAGRFSGTVTLDDEDDISAYFNPRISDYTFAESQSQHISVQPLPTRITVKVTPAQVKEGEPVTISGQLMWKSPDGWQPLANRPFGILACDESMQCPGGPIDTPDTDADGRFSVSAVPYSTGYYQVGFSGRDEDGGSDPFLPLVTQTAPVSVLHPAYFSDFSAARDEAGQVVASGHMNFGEYFTPGVIPVQIQYRAPGTASTWVTAATIGSADWDGTGYGFSATIDQPAGGQWRAHYPGQPKWFPAATSPKVQVAAAS